MSDVITYTLICVIFVIGVVCLSGDVCDLILTGNNGINIDDNGGDVNIDVNGGDDDMIIDVDECYENVSENMKNV